MNDGDSIMQDDRYYQIQKDIQQLFILTDKLVAMYWDNKHCITTTNTRLHNVLSIIYEMQNDELQKSSKTKNVNTRNV